MKGIPKTEKIHVTEKAASGEVFYITSKDGVSNCYYIYKQTPDGVMKLDKGRTPPELERKYIH